MLHENNLITLPRCINLLGVFSKPLSMYKFLMPESSSIMFLSPVNFYSFVKYYLRLKITFQLFLVNNNKRYMGKNGYRSNCTYLCQGHPSWLHDSLQFFSCTLQCNTKVKQTLREEALSQYPSLFSLFSSFLTHYFFISFIYFQAPRFNSILL